MNIFDIFGVERVTDQHDTDKVSIGLPDLEEEGESFDEKIEAFENRSSFSFFDSLIDMAL